ncbi:MAG: ROK family protein [Ardenticatenaceae bacterium]
MALYIGLDFGGTKLMAGAAQGESYDVVRRVREPTPRGLDEGLALLNRMVERVAAGDTILGIGAAIGGPLDWRRGIVSPLHQPEWREVPLKEIMEARWGCPFYVDVDTNVAAMAEYYVGRESASHMLYMTVSTGVGGGFLVSGQIYRGMRGEHPEIGHQSIPYHCSRPERVHCECGVPDCLEALVSGNGIRRIYGKPAEGLNDEEWAEVAYNLGQGLRNLASIYLPDVIVLGGGVAVGGGENLLAQARQVMQGHLCLVPAPQLRLSRLGYDTALLGAVVIARQGLT